MADIFEPPAPRPGCRLLLVRAAAGSEWVKALRRWADQGEAPTGWLTLGPSDNEPARFVSRIRAALEKATGESLGLAQWDGTAAQAAGPDGAELLGIDLLNDLARLRVSHQVVALENYDVITAAEVHAIVQLMLDYPPPGLLLIVVAETSPPLDLARLRVRRHLMEID
jgi:LuxR family transcriptional regulator, maltose regulon positive regulatory protein